MVIDDLSKFGGAVGGFHGHFRSRKNKSVEYCLSNSIAAAQIIYGKSRIASSGKLYNASA
jgi:hypothetical protein